MPPVPTLPDFGRMTVSPLFGWGSVVAVVVLVLVVAAVAFVLLATGTAQTSRSEFEAWLDARSPAHDALDADPLLGAERFSAAGSAGGDLDRSGRG